MPETPPSQLTFGFDEIARDAVLSPDRLYRYQLIRRWGAGDLVAWIMLNPSTADADIDDPTITRCMGFARRWGYAGIVVVNRFALRSTDPDQLLTSTDPFGPNNTETLQSVAAYPLIIAAWGSHKATRQLDAHLPVGLDLHCLAVNSDGSPKHPLYVRGDVSLARWVRT